MDGYDIFRTAVVVGALSLAIKYPRFRIALIAVCLGVGVWAALEQFYFAA